jgi:hypothetical protein
MSHLVKIQTEIRDPAAVMSACQRLALPVPSHRTVTFFNSEATGLAVELPDWRYPVVCQTETGQLHYDNYEGRWGDQKHLDTFKQTYAIEKAKLEARREGRTAIEQPLDDGWVRVRIPVAA